MSEQNQKSSSANPRKSQKRENQIFQKYDERLVWRCRQHDLKVQW